MLSTGRYFCARSQLTGLRTPFNHTSRQHARPNSCRRHMSEQVQKKGLVPDIVEINAPHNGHINSSRVWKSLIFTVAFGTSAFACASILEYEKIRAKAVRVLKAKRVFDWVNTKVDRSHKEISAWRREVEKYWQMLTPGEQVFAPLCALNLLVFGLWRIPRLQPFMIKYFCSNPAGKAVCWPMVLSTFSHYSMFHIFANMYVLHSFSTGAVAALGREQYLGMYLSAGVVASFASYAYKAITRQPGFSLGASGAIMAILAYVCAHYPDTQLSILFLPMVQFSAGAAIKVIMGIDLAGVLLGWRFFDHAAHLGGAAFGLFWCYYGQQYIWPEREHLIGYWHQLRGPTRK